MSEPNGGRSLFSVFSRQIITKIARQIDDPEDVFHFGLTCKKAWANTGTRFLIEADARFFRDHEQEVQDYDEDYEGREPFVMTVIKWTIVHKWTIPDHMIKTAIDVYNEIDPDSLRWGWTSSNFKPGVAMSPVGTVILEGQQTILEYLIETCDVNPGLCILDPLAWPRCDDIHNTIFHIACEIYNNRAAKFLADKMVIGPEHLADALEADNPEIVAYVLQKPMFQGSDRAVQIQEAFFPSGDRDDYDNEDFEGIDKWSDRNSIGKGMQALIAATGTDVIKNDKIMKRAMKHMIATKERAIQGVWDAWKATGRPSDAIVEVVTRHIASTVFYH